MSGKSQRIPGVGNLRAVGADDDLDDVQTYGDIGIGEEAQPGLRAADEGFFLGGIDRVGWAAGAAGGAGFYLDKDEGLFFPADQVDLAAALGAEVAVENFEAAAPEMAGGKTLTKAAQAQVRGLSWRGKGAGVQPGEKSCDEWGKDHGF